MNNKPLVSVVIPTYKRSEMLKNAIKSVLKQTYKNVEIIVVDDNDPDSAERKQTQQLMENYKKHKKILYLLHPKNMNGAAARNTGFKNANGKYIAILDDDDEFLPDKIQLQVDKLESLDDSWGICYTQFIRKKNNRIIDRGIENMEGYVSNEVLKGGLYISAGSNLMIRSDVVDKIGGFDESFPRKQDLEFLIRASRVAKITHVPKICLIINKDDRTNVLSEKELVRNTEKFLKTFAKYIEKLPGQERRKIIIGQNLLIARYYLIRGKFRSMYKICKENNITLLIFVRYLLYLVRRKVFKQCYGFKF